MKICNCALSCTVPVCVVVRASSEGGECAVEFEKANNNVLLYVLLFRACSYLLEEDAGRSHFLAAEFESVVARERTKERGGALARED